MSLRYSRAANKMAEEVGGAREKDFMNCSGEEAEPHHGEIMTRSSKRKHLEKQQQNYQLFKCRPIVALTPCQFVPTSSPVVLQKKAKLENLIITPISRRKTQIETGKLLLLEWENMRKNSVPPTLQSLPPEMRDMILRNISDPIDLKNCCKASPCLDEVLQIRKPVFLLKEVLPHIVSGNALLSKTDLLTCRLVCKEWLEDIDNFMDNHPISSPYNDAFHLQQMERHAHGSCQEMNYFLDPYSRFSVPAVTLYCTAESLNSFQETYNRLCLPSSPGRNPFRGRSVQLVIDTITPVGNHDNWEQIGRTLERTQEFLRNFGQHIWHLSIQVRGHLLLTFRVYSDLRVIFTHVPNLRSFTLTTPPVPQIIRELVGLAIRLNVEGEMPLQHLEALTIFHLSENSQEVTKLLVQPFMNQLKKLSLTSWTSNDEDVSDFPNLLELQLMIVESNGCLENLLKINAPRLQKLSLTFNFRKIDVKILNKVLANFLSLKVLALNWCGLTTAKQPYIEKTGPPPLHLQLPSLHTLKICSSSDVNFSFLRWFPNLEYMYIAQWIPSGGPPLTKLPSGRLLKRIANREVIEMHKYLYAGNMEDSNVWNVLPRLQIVNMQRIRQPTPENQILSPWLRLNCILKSWKRPHFSIAKVSKKGV